MTRWAIFEGDDLIYDVTVSDDAGAAVNLTDATVEAAALSADGTSRVTGTALVSDAAAGEILVTFADGDLTARSGDWRVQTRVTRELETQTVHEGAVQVKASAFA